MSEKSLGDQIKAAREKRKWSQEKLAEKLGTSARTVVRWENNGKFPNYENQQELINHLGLQVEDFQRKPPEQVSEELGALSELSDIERMLPPKDDFKLYCGRRVYKRYGHGVVSKKTYVTVNGRPLKYFGPWNRNPEEEKVFEWGYYGAGPRTLAESILADYLGENYPEQGYADQSDYNALLYGSLLKEHVIGNIGNIQGHTEDNMPYQMLDIDAEQADTEPPPDLLTRLFRSAPSHNIRFDIGDNTDDAWQISSDQIRRWFYSLEENGITRKSLLKNIYGE